MPIAQVLEISAMSEDSFEDAVRQGIEEAGEMFENVTGAWIKEQKVKIEDGEIVEFNVNMQITAMTEEETMRRSSGGSSSRSAQRSSEEERGNVVYPARKPRRQE